MKSNPLISGNQPAGFIDLVPSIEPRRCACCPGSSAGGYVPIAVGTGKAWMAIDGIDNGTKRPASSSHNYSWGCDRFCSAREYGHRRNTSSFWSRLPRQGL